MRTLLLLLTCLALPAAADGVAGDGAEGRCMALADLVAEHCPGSCMRTHCSQRCVPPVADDGSCLRCQENCAVVCEAQSARRVQDCRTGVRESAGETPQG